MYNKLFNLYILQIMKKKYFSVALVLALIGSIMSTSCIGSFSLTNKLLSWNQSIGDKFVNEVVFFAFCIIPVYEVAALADILVLNSIEFWSGNNALAKGTKVIEGQDGRYLVECDGKGYIIKSENDGSIVRLDFDQEDLSWSANVNGETHKFLTFVDDTHVKVPSVNGGFEVVELTQGGVWAYQSKVAYSQFALK